MTAARARRPIGRLLVYLAVGACWTGCVLSDDYYLVSSEGEGPLTVSEEDSQAGDDEQADEAVSDDESTSAAGATSADQSEDSATAELDGVAEDEDAAQDDAASDDSPSRAEIEATDTGADTETAGVAGADDQDANDDQQPGGETDVAATTEGDGADDAEADDDGSVESDDDDDEFDSPSDDDDDDDDEGWTGSNPRDRDAGAADVTEPEADTTADPEPTPQCGEGWSYDPERGACTSDCQEGEMRGPTGRCYWFAVQTQSFYAAESTCEDRGDGWTLIMPRSEEEDAFFQAQLSSDTWIGARDAQVPNQWRWGDDNRSFWSGNEYGTAVDGAYTNWGNGEPSAANDEACARYHGTQGEMKWSDGDCADRQRVACQGPEPVEPTFD